MSEAQKPFTPQGRENYDKIFCPYHHEQGADYALSGDCLECINDYPEHHYICAGVYRLTLPGGKDV